MKQIGLVISGGGANGLFALQIIKNLINDGLNLKDIKWVSGVSVGAFIGAMIAQDEFDIIYEEFPKIKNNQIFDGKFNIWYAMYNRLLGRNYVLDISPLFRLFSKYIDLDKAKQSGKIFHIGITNFETGLYEELTQFDFDNNDDYLKAIIASGSQPIIWKNISFKTTTKEIKYGYDGGVIHVSPIKELLAYNPDELIIINNSPSDIKYNEKLKFTELILMRMISIMITASFNKDLKTFIEINKIIETFGEYENRKFFPYKFFQITLHNDTLDFESKILIEQRIHNANLVYTNKKNKK